MIALAREAASNVTPDPRPRPNDQAHFCRSPAAQVAAEARIGRVRERRVTLTARCTAYDLPRVSV